MAVCLKDEVSGAVTLGQDRHAATRRVRNDGERRAAQKFSTREEVFCSRPATTLGTADDVVDWCREC
jgi:hypothetical protein